MIETTQSIYQSSLFDHPAIIHGFSTTKFGDMRDKEKQKIFLSALTISEESLIWQEQVHADGIHIVTENDRGKIIQGADGLVFCHPGLASPIQADRRSRDPGSRKQYPDSRLRGNDSGRDGNEKENSIVLSVHTADCIPLLFFDPVAKSIAVAHAGWKGTTLHIGKKVIEHMKQLGSATSDIRVAIGPHICARCYDVDKDRAAAFRNAFTSLSRNQNIHNSGKEEPDFVEEKEGTFFIHLGKANYYDLIAEGIDQAHIDFDPTLCTFEKSDAFYSYRRSGKPLNGEIIGVIGFR